MGKNKHIDLKELRGENPFTVPDGYFEYFPDKLFRIIDRKSVDKPKPALVRVLKPALWLAASFLIILSGIGITLKYVERINTGRSAREYAFSHDEQTILQTLNDRTIWELLQAPFESVELSEEELKEVLLASLSDYDLTN